MAQGDVARRLAAIVSADVVGYSRLMAEDEQATLVALKAHRDELIDPAIARHSGRIVKLMGDGILIEFSSVVDAVRSSVEIQLGMRHRNLMVPEQRRLQFRIGINQGEVVIDGDDIYGDGVNVAARLQEVAEPGGISISDRVYSDVRGKLEIGFKDLGEKKLKNIPEPLRTFNVLVEGASSGLTLSPPSPRSFRTWTVVVSVVLIAAIGGGYLWWQPWIERETPVDAGKMALPLPDKPSIAVLPFQNMSDDPEQAYFADGMAEDIITDLSKLSGLFVIARNSSFQYRGEGVDVKMVGRELGVKYVLEGSVRRAGDQVRINAQLIDTQSSGHLWAERYDGKLTNVFSLQDQITARIVEALSLRLGIEEKARLADRDTTNSKAHDAFIKGWQHLQRETLDGFVAAQPHLEEAVALDPGMRRGEP